MTIAGKPDEPSGPLARTSFAAGPQACATRPRADEAPRLIGEGFAALTRRGVLAAGLTLGAAPALLALPVGSTGDPLHAWSEGTAAGLAAWIRARLAEVRDAAEAMAAVRGRRTVANTLEPYDAARNALAMAANQAQLLGSAGADGDLREQARRSLEEVNAAAADFDLDPRLHAALLTLSVTKEARRSEPATRRYLEQALLRGRLAGADRDRPTREAIRRVQARIADVGARYMGNMQGPVPIVAATAEELVGMPPDFASRHRPDARGVISLRVSQIDLLPILRFAPAPALRRRMHLAFENQAYPANGAVLAELVSARAELARHLGFADYADLTLADQMIRTADAAEALLDRIEAVARPIAARNAAEVGAFARANGYAEDLTSSDAPFWNERFLRERFGVDGREIRAHLPFARVRAGVMDFVARLLHVRFVPVNGRVAWHAAVAVFDIHDAAPGGDGGRLGRIYLDCHPREGKDQIFATAPLVPGVAGRQLPEGVVLCNLPGGDADDPGLMSHGDLVNFLHEFGHLVHHVLAGRGRWSGQGAFDVEEDFLEAPSQMLEEFSRDRGVLRGMARHHETGQPLSDEALAGLERSAVFARAGWVMSQLERARFALAIHRRAFDAAGIEAEHRAGQRRDWGFRPVDGTHSYAAWPHLLGYGPNYYMYLLDKVIAVDLAARFAVDDPATGATPMEYREHVLAPGASHPARKLVRDFLRRDEQVTSLASWLEGDTRRR